jgi:hypothetical protein
VVFVAVHEICYFAIRHLAYADGSQLLIAERGISLLTMNDMATRTGALALPLYNRPTRLRGRENHNSRVWKLSDGVKK